MRGVFITFEGGDGAGKTTQMRLLAEVVRRGGVEPVVVREPGGTRTGESVREILLGPAHDDLTAVAELFLFAASRAQLTAEVIVPALESGRVVLCDRYADSTTAYQGYGRGLDLDLVRRVNEAATGGLVPDLTIVLDVDPRQGVAAASAGGADRMERQAIAFHERVRAGYAAIAAAEPKRVKVIERGPVDAVWREVSCVAAPVLAGAGVRIDEGER
ncbi:MAG: dTMP kinase [Anaerosomatales bacterium]|nr:dTMP kinase [Anaerosomatales bacterium]GAV31638.1 dTMP kinase [Coriobacteriaceae bacterium EMTCatB1]